MLMMVCAIILTGDVYRLPSEPFPVQDENNPATYLSGIAQLESNGKDLFFLTLREPGVLQFSGDGSFVRRIGRKGQGPGELGIRRSSAMAVDGETVWIRSRLRVFMFHEGDFQHSFAIKNYQHRGSTYPSNAFVFSPDHLLVQAHPSSLHIAAVYNYDGSVHKMVGDLASRNPTFLKTNPALNFTFWARDKDHYYCLFAYRPKIVVYDSAFEKVRELTIKGPEVSEFEEKYFRNEPDPRFTYPMPHFTDFKVFGDHLYVLCDGTLYQLAKEDGRTLSRSIFVGNERAWRELGGRNKIHYKYMAFLDNGTFLLSGRSAFLDVLLWKAELPFIIPDTKPGKVREQGGR
jgi:hypothetical protein